MYNVLHYIHNHLLDKLSVTEISDMFGYSLSHFCVKFHRYTGRSFRSYLRYYRMQQALTDILDGMSVTDAAMRYGYDSVGGFCKAFYSEFGYSPRDVVKKNKNDYLAYQERKMNMTQLSDRCFILREEAVHQHSMNHIVEPQFDIWNQVSFRDIPDTASRSYAIAHGIALLAENFPPVIRDFELIVGDNFGFNEYPCIPAERLTDAAFLAQSGLLDSQISFVLEAMKRPPVMYPWICVPYNEQEQLLNDEWVSMGRCMDSNHTVLGYEKVIRLGFDGLLKEVQKLALEHPENKALYDSAAEICRGGCIIGERYAQQAEKMAQKPGISQERREELLTIAKTCHRVPKYGATNLQEAIQSLWFAHIFNTWEDHINANSVGRLDQILYPYYLQDINAGRLQEADVYELIACLWNKLYRDYDVQQSCVGGCHRDGSDAVNRLSYIMLDVTEQLDYIRCLSVRFSQQTDPAFIRRALEVVGHLGKGVPFFFNDDVMIPALVNAGISLEDARDYTQIGCVETVIPGKSNPHAVTGETNLLKALEFVLLNGCSMLQPEKVCGLKTGDPVDFISYSQLEEAVYAQIYLILDTCCRKVAEHRVASENNSPRPFKSLLTEGCMESGRDFNCQGSKYDYYQIMLGGIPNLADSLAVLRKFVFEDKKYTLSFVVEQLKADFPDEKIRLEFVNQAPKYGNDIDFVDGIVVEITNRCCDILEEMTEKYGLSFHAQPFTFLWMIDHGRFTGASPDGRRSGEIVAYSISPMQGRDFQGLVALMNSIAKLPTTRTPGTSSAIVEVDPKLFNDGNIGRIADILMTAAKRGLSNVQFNTVSVETLLDAQKNPEKHANLAVRVSGFSQKFNLISPELQNHIIERTKHQCL